MSQVKERQYIDNPNAGPTIPFPQSAPNSNMSLIKSYRVESPVRLHSMLCLNMHSLVEENLGGREVN